MKERIKELYCIYILVVLVSISSKQPWGPTLQLSQRCAHILEGVIHNCQWVGWWYWEVDSISNVYVSMYWCSLSKSILMNTNTSSFSHKMAMCGQDRLLMLLPGIDCRCSSVGCLGGSTPRGQRQAGGSGGVDVCASSCCTMPGVPLSQP